MRKKYQVFLFLFVDKKFEGIWMAVLENGQKVSIFFEAKLENGETVLKTDDKQPLEIKIGEGTIPQSIEKAITEMNAGDSETITLEPEEAFGPIINELIIDLPMEGFGEAEQLMVGSKVSMNSPEGKKFIGIIIEITDEKVKVDFNHPLAGKKLLFTVTVVSII